ncbi:ABC transporter ATP-binding protein [Dactylosporangium sp. CA-233914]|uniref:ABC transporter ATP-binding protein n=1 Tax=Dactylosporangium sp. CA-233914 TaxID=3239934 RepID=UPI003D946F32
MPLRTSTQGKNTDPVGKQLHDTLTADSITKRFGKDPEFVALQDVSIRLAKGEFVSILGPSGCGKTTLLRICAGLATPTEGALLHDGVEGPATRKSFGMVFQQPGLLPWHNVLANVELGARLLRLDRQRARRRAQELLEMVGLSDAQAKFPSELSGGMQQRVAIARALLHDPALLFMDEPFGALDALTREHMNSELQTIHMREGKSVLLVTHSIREAVFLSDRIYVMSSSPGRIIEEINVDIPRPRTNDSDAAPELARLEEHLRGLLVEGGSQ